MTAPADDLDRIMAVMATAFDPAFGEAWTRRQVEDALVLGPSHYALITAQGSPAAPGEAPAGFYLARRGFEEEELLLLAVDPSWRRRGLASILIDCLCAKAQEHGAQRIFLEMRRGNPAEQLYLRCGFQTIGIRPGYYRSSDGSRTDAITFRLDFQ
jgi:ribosomal-protein-alanine N-acetyltransferase